MKSAILVKIEYLGLDENVPLVECADACQFCSGIEPVVALILVGRDGTGNILQICEGCLFDIIRSVGDTIRYVAAAARGDIDYTSTLPEHFFGRFSSHKVMCDACGCGVPGKFCVDVTAVNDKGVDSVIATICKDHFVELCRCIVDYIDDTGCVY